MRVHLVFIVYLMAGVAVSQVQEAQIVTSVTTARLEDGSVTVLHLAPGFTSSVKLPEEISSVVIGNPASFKAEHSEAEARLVFFKPTTSQASESNALITTASGREISLHLKSSGKGVKNTPVDFLIEYLRPQNMLISSDRQSFLIAEIRALSVLPSAAPQINSDRQGPMAQQLEKQKALPSPRWQGKELLVALGGSVESHNETFLAFSVLNDSQQVIELLPPQLELTGTAHGNKRKRIKGDPVAISDYRITSRRLQPGQRADGVIVYARPAFKQSSETLQLQVTEAERVECPILVPVPFIAGSQEGEK